MVHGLVGITEAGRIEQTMSVFFGTMTSKGQTTVPSEVRDLLNLKPGDKISYVIDGDTVTIKAKNRRAVDLIGILHDPGRQALSLKQIDDAMTGYLGEKYGRTLDDRDRHERASVGDAG